MSNDGGAASVIEIGAGAGGEGAGGGGDGGQGAGAGAGGSDGGQGAGAGGGALPAWLEGFSAEAPDADTPSHRDWLASKGFKDLDSVAKSYRETEKAYLSGDKIVLPKEGDDPAKFESFYKAIGRPETAEGYEIKLPDGVEGELDPTLLGSFREAAFKIGLPASMAAGLGSWFIQQQLDADAMVVQQRDSEADALLKEWGAQKDANVALINRAAQKLGLNRAAVADIQKGFGARRTLEMLQKLGAGMAEDVLIDGGGRQRFGVTGAEARAELDKLLADKEWSAKVARKDPDAIARKTRLEAAIAAEMDQKQRAA